MASTAEKSMDQLYRRLRELGVETPYVQKIALPSWWDESVAESASGYQETLLLLSRHLGLGMKSLQDGNSRPEFRDLGPCNFKKSKGVTEDDLKIARVISTRAAQIVAASVETPWQGVIPANGTAIRESILRSGAPWVGLKQLVDWCWSVGIPVLHISHFPKGAKKMHGMAANVDGRPVIVLCKNFKQEAWLLFDLAHELGHIVCGHVSPNGVLVDEQITEEDDGSDVQEAEANATAVEILTGDANCRFTAPGRWPNASQLAEMAKAYGHRHQVDPGHVALNYSNNRGSGFHALGSAALKEIHPRADAPRLVYEKMVAALNWGGIPEDSAEFLTKVSQPRHSP